MSRRALVQIGLVLVGVIGIGTQRTMVRADEDPRTALRFLQELRDHGLHDLAIEFIDELRVDPGLPADLKVVLDYQEGRTEIDEAAKTGDLVHRRELLEQARTKLESFVKAQPNHPLAREAMVQGARMLVEHNVRYASLAEQGFDHRNQHRVIGAHDLAQAHFRRLRAPGAQHGPQHQRRHDDQTGNRKPHRSLRASREMTFAWCGARALAHAA